MAVIGSYSATDLATRHIRGLIMSAELVPGTKINIEKLATDMGFSRTPVRDALTRLQNEGLVRIVSRVGVYVREISPDEVLEVYSVKESLEPLMASWATERSTPEERRAFYDSLSPLAQHLADGDSAAYTDLVVERRLHMLRLSRSEVLSSIFGLIDQRVRLMRARNLRSPDRLADSFREHTAIAEAFRDGKAELAGELTRSHVRSARRSLLTVIDTMRREAEEKSPPVQS